MRVAGAEEILARAAQPGLYTCDIDEKKFPVPTLTKATAHPDSDVESEENAKLYFKMVSRKRNNEAAVMAFAIVTEPYLNPEWTDERNHQVFGGCANPNWHGHNYKLRVTVEGELDPDTGFVIDFRDLNSLVDSVVIKDLDHKNINLDVPWMEGVINIR